MIFLQDDESFDAVIERAVEPQLVGGDDIGQVTPLYLVVKG